MNNTALRAVAQGTTSHKKSVTCGDHPYDIAHMVFVNEKHEKFYYEKMKQARKQDCYHKVLIYILGISGAARKHFSRIYDMKTGRIKKECLHEALQRWRRKNAENPVNGDKE